MSVGYWRGEIVPRFFENQGVSYRIESFSVLLQRPKPFDGSSASR